MFTETYLGGEVTFNSSKYDGTTFSIWLPRAACDGPAADASGS